MSLVGSTITSGNCTETTTINYKRKAYLNLIFNNTGILPTQPTKNQSTNTSVKRSCSM